MATDFPLFPSLPPELRLHIWRLALTSSWSCTTRKCIRYQQDATIGAHPHNSISQSCTEARQVLTQTLTKIDRLGWFNFPRHLLFLQRLGAGGLGRRCPVEARRALSRNVQHIVVNAHGKLQMYSILEYLHKASPKLKSVVVVGPWFLPEDTDVYDSVRDWIAPYEDWGQVFLDSPMQVDLDVLTKAIERGEGDGDCRLAHGLSVEQYKARLDKAVRRLPHPLPDGLRPIDNVYWRTRRMLDKVESILQKYSTPPRLYLQTAEQMRVSRKQTGKRPSKRKR
ncbi:hypothetical protein PEBR_11696 [Penicillium brasilianum]|uniref:2EXR domain-containing protein n=1 Tax=Penicillium brasilianum TaxID=104259 RepID=A0A1S9RTJ7_PENBI|nr:hypothetical protein PEBR_11696 [Penicillium brasilianum]